MSDLSSAPWQDDLFNALKQADIRQLPYVPDAGHAHVLARAHQDDQIRPVVLTTEEEGIALAAGAWLGGQRSVQLMQSSGVGNCLNMLTLMSNCRFPFATIITMRGEWAEFNYWQNPMGRATQASLELMGVAVLRADQPEEVGPTVSAALHAAFVGGDAVAVLLSQKLIGRKEW